jgi:hypothetical protein
MLPGAAIGGAWADDRDVAAFHSGYGPLPDRELDSAVIAYYRADRGARRRRPVHRRDPRPPRRTEDRPRALRFLTTTLGPGDAAEAAERSIAVLT